MAITAVGSMALAGAGATTLAVNPTATGDILVIFFTNEGGSAVPSSVSGGGVTVWNQLNHDTETTAAAVASAIWWGVVTTAGSGTVTVSGAGSTTAFGAQQFTGGAGTWSADSVNPSIPNGGSGTGTTGLGFTPSGTITPTGAGELFLGIGTGLATPLTGSTSGFTYTNPLGAGTNETTAIVVWNTSAPSPSAPTWGQASSQHYASTGGLLVFTSKYAPLGKIQPRQAIRRASLM